MWLKTNTEKYKKVPLAAKVSFWFFFCSVIQKGITMLTIPVITRMLSTSEYGVYSVFNSYGNILTTIVTLNVAGNSYNVGMKKYKGRKQQYTSSVAGLMNLVIAAALGLFWIIRDGVSQITGLGTTAYLLMFVWIYGQGMTNLWLVSNRYDFKYRLIVVGTLFIAVSTPILKIFLINCFQKTGVDKSLGAILGLVIPVTAVGLIAGIGMFARGKCFYKKEFWKFAIVFNIPLIPYYLSQNILNQADRIMIERMDSASSAGIYSVAYSLAMAVSIINAAVNSSFIPWQFQAIEKGEQRRVAKLVDVMMVIVAVCHLLVIFTAPEIMRIFAAKEYYAAIYVIPPVTVGVLVIWLTQIFINVEFYYEKNKHIAISSCVSAGLNVFLNAAAIPRFGYLAAGYTTLICYLANMVFHGVVAVHLTNAKKEEQAFHLNRIIRLTVGCIVFMGVIMFLYRFVALRYCLLLGIISVMLCSYRRWKLFLRNMWKTVRER